MNPSEIGLMRWEESDVKPEQRAALGGEAAAELSEAGRGGEERAALEAVYYALGAWEVGPRAEVSIRRASVEVREARYYEARRVLEETRPLLAEADDALRGEWHGLAGLVCRRLASAEGRDEYFEQAADEYDASNIYYGRAGRETNVARNLNSLAFLLYRLGRHAEAHEHLDRARAAFVSLGDADGLARAGETRASLLVAEGRYEEAERVIDEVVAHREAGGEPALLADALTVQGVVRARLAAPESSIETLRRAMKVAQDSGAQTLAGLAALTIIEEHGESNRLSNSELLKIYRRADDLLKGTQNAEDLARLRACARAVIKRLSGAPFHEKDFSFYGAVHELEARLIEQALELEGGSLTRAAKRLGLKHQSLSHMLRLRHSNLLGKRTPPIPRRKQKHGSQNDEH